jgi:hypothetical protein
MRRRGAVEPVIVHIKNELRMDRNYLAHSSGDVSNAILADAGYNFRFLLNWMRHSFCVSFSLPCPSAQTVCDLNGELFMADHTVEWHYIALGKSMQTAWRSHRGGWSEYVN